MTKFFINADGKYLGGFDGAKPPAGAIEVQAPPQDGRFKWDGSAWIEPEEIKEQLVTERRRDEYIRLGVNLEQAVVALWEKVMENRPEAADELQKIREQVKKDFPTP